VFAAVLSAIAAASNETFRVVHFSAQEDHLHLIVEAQDGKALTSGMSGLAIRAALAINRAVGRKGSVWGERYHAHELGCPKETRHSMVYVLMNFKKHDFRETRRIDNCSSAPWFNGFSEPIPRPSGPSPVRPARTWHAREGWLRAGGPIRLHEAPAKSPRAFPGKPRHG
jgi:REP element-mobilizing transposase RayT